MSFNHPKRFPEYRIKIPILKLIQLIKKWKRSNNKKNCIWQCENCGWKEPKNENIPYCPKCGMKIICK